MQHPTRTLLISLATGTRRRSLDPTLPGGGGGAELRDARAGALEQQKATPGGKRGIGLYHNRRGREGQLISMVERMNAPTLPFKRA